MKTNFLLAGVSLLVFGICAGFLLNSSSGLESMGEWFLLVTLIVSGAGFVFNTGQFSIFYRCCKPALYELERSFSEMRERMLRQLHSSDFEEKKLLLEVLEGLEMAFLKNLSTARERFSYWNEQKTMEFLNKAQDCKKTYFEVCKRAENTGWNFRERYYNFVCEELLLKAAYQMEKFDLLLEGCRKSEMDSSHFADLELMLEQSNKVFDPLFVQKPSREKYCQLVDFLNSLRDDISALHTDGLMPPIVKYFEYLKAEKGVVEAVTFLACFDEFFTCVHKHGKNMGVSGLVVVYTRLMEIHSGLGQFKRGSFHYAAELSALDNRSIAFTETKMRYVLSPVDVLLSQQELELKQLFNNMKLLDGVYAVEAKDIPDYDKKRNEKLGYLRGYLYLKEMELCINNFFPSEELMRFLREIDITFKIGKEQRVLKLYKEQWNSEVKEEAKGPETVQA